MPIFLSPRFTECQHLALFVLLLFIFSWPTLLWPLLVSLFLLNSLQVPCGRCQHCVLERRTFSYTTTLSLCFSECLYSGFTMCPNNVLYGNFCLPIQLHSGITRHIFNLQHPSASVCLSFHLQFGRGPIYPPVDCPSIWVCLLGFNWAYAFLET